MADHPQKLIQTKLFEILNGDSDLTNLIQGVFDNVPDNQTFPYVTVGEISMSHMGGFSFDGFDGDYTIHTWSRARGRQSSQLILNRIYTLLHTTKLSLADGFNTMVNTCELNEILLDPDGVTYHGVQRYRLMLGGN